MAEDGMVGWHHRLDGHKFEPAPGDGEGQSSPWGCTESETTELLDNNIKHWPCTQA